MFRATSSLIRSIRPVGTRAMANDSGHVNESRGAFRDREHALENQYFNKEELALLEKLKKNLAGAAAAKAPAAAAAAPHDAPVIHHGQAYVSLETFQKFARDVLTSLKTLEDTASKKK